ncbi:hypothetical protein M3Y99_00510500 [Aphelenchoides fujianensis]|nr:hypothetical protein M3Y99_00510500 [Aphelenchoides fujianensis]
MAAKALIKQHFNPEPTELQLEDKIWLEDFYDCDEEPPNTQLRKLALSLSFENGTPAETEAFYAQAIRNLHKIAPQVTSITFNGGFCYSPLEETPDAFRRELHDLKNHFDSLARLFKANEMPVQDVHFSGMLTLERFTLLDADYPQLIHELFGHAVSTNEADQYMAAFDYTAEGIVFHVKLFMNITILRHYEPLARRRFYDAVRSCT